VERANDRSSGAFVFPGGTLDETDACCHAVCAGIDDAAASARLGIDGNGLDYYVAAIRECFEEAGVLLADDVKPSDAWPELRTRVRHGELTIDAVCALLGVKLAADRLAYHSHWLTPVGLPKRFDTRFFIAAMPPGQSAASDSDETLEHRWIRPAEALDPANGLRLPTPTQRTLAAIAR